MIEPWMIVLGAQAMMAAAAWGDIRAKVTGIQKLQDARHEENKAWMVEISRDVKRINGTVSEHEGILKNKARSRKSS